MDSVHDILTDPFELWPRWRKVAISLEGEITITDGTINEATMAPDAMGGDKHLALSGSVDWLRWQGTPGDPFFWGARAGRFGDSGLYTYAGTIADVQVIPSGFSGTWGNYASHSSGFAISPAVNSNPGGLRERGDGRLISVGMTLGGGPMFAAWSNTVSGTEPIGPSGNPYGQRVTVADPPDPQVIELINLAAAPLEFEGECLIEETYFPGMSGTAGTYTMHYYLKGSLTFSASP